ncbi:hypothetical protein J6590_062443 [Homalodisca vitripennis]|nr:hypothetical protein J6590_062443 [Homalodisca vitripennis]
MINVVSKSANLSPYLKATSQAVASSVKPLVKPAVIPGKSIYPTPPVPLTSYALTKLLPSNDIKVRTGPTVTTQVRWAHTDIQVPDFSSYRRKATRDPTSKNVNSDESRKAFTYLIVGGTNGSQSVPSPDCRAGDRELLPTKLLNQCLSVTSGMGPSIVMEQHNSVTEHSSQIVLSCPL